MATDGLHWPHCIDGQCPGCLSELSGLDLDTSALYSVTTEPPVWSRPDANPLDDLRKAYALIRDMPYRYVYRVLEVGQALHDMMVNAARDPANLNALLLFGLPVRLDGGLAPMAWRLVDQDGNVMQEGDEGQRRLGIAVADSIRDPETGDVWVEVRLDGQ